MANIINISKGVGTAITRTEGWNAYITDIRKYSIIEQEDEENLLREYVSTTDSSRKLQIRNTLLTANQRFIVAAAKQYANNNVELLLELIGEANIGFITGIESFDFSKAKEGMRLCSWASYYIRREINQYLQNYGAMVRQTNNSITSHKLSKIRSKLTQELEREPTEEEIIEYLSKDPRNSIKEVRDVIKVQVTSVDAPFNDDDDSFNPAMYEYNAYTANSSDAETIHEQDYTKTLITKALSTLSAKEQEIIKMLYGLGDVTVPYSTEIVAEKFHFTTERIRQIHVNALKKMATALATKTKNI